MLTGSKQGQASCQEEETKYAFFTNTWAQRRESTFKYALELNSSRIHVEINIINHRQWNCYDHAEEQINADLSPRRLKGYHVASFESFEQRCPRHEGEPDRHAFQ